MRAEEIFIRLLLAFALALLSSLAVAQPIFPPGSRIGIVPPPGMTMNARGFEDRARGALLVVQELSLQSFVQVEQEFSDERMRAGGMEPIARETIETPGGPAQLIGARQMENGVAMRKWALLTRTDDMTAIVIAALPEAAKDVYTDAVLRTALASTFIRVKLSPDDLRAVLPYRLGDLGGFRILRTALASTFIRVKLSPDDLRAVLPYRLGDLGGFRILRAAPDGTAIFTLGPNDTSLPADQPYFVIRLAQSPPQAAERERAAQRALTEFMDRPGYRVIASEPIRIGGEPGHEILVESEDRRTGDPLMIVQWLRFGAAGVTEMRGMARKDQWADVLPRMRALRDGFAAK